MTKNFADHEPEKPRKSSILDMDGTILSAWQNHVEFYMTRLNSEYVFNFTHEDVAKLLKGRSFKENISVLRDEFKKRAGFSIPKGHKDWDSFYSREKEEVKRILGARRAHLIPGMGETLELLKSSGIMTSLATNETAGGMKRKLCEARLCDDRALDSLFAGRAVCRDDVNKAKPDPDMLELAAWLAGEDIKTSIFFGDSKLDMEAGKRAGCLAVVFSAADYAEYDEDGNFLGIDEWVFDIFKEMQKHGATHMAQSPAQVLELARFL